MSAGPIASDVPRRWRQKILKFAHEFIVFPRRLIPRTIRGHEPSWDNREWSWALQRKKQDDFSSKISHDI